MSRRIALIAALLVALLTLACGCAAVWSSPPYDPAFDAALGDFRKDADAFFEDVACAAGTPDGTWEHFEGAYRTLEDELSGLTQQAALGRRGAPAMESLGLVAQNLDAIEAMHRDGITPAEVTVVRRLVDTQVRLLIQLERAKRGMEAQP